VRERAVGPVGEDLLRDRVIAVLSRLSHLQVSAIKVEPSWVFRGGGHADDGGAGGLGQRRAECGCVEVEYVDPRPEPRAQALTACWSSRFERVSRCGGLRHSGLSELAGGGGGSPGTQHQPPSSTLKHQDLVLLARSDRSSDVTASPLRRSRCS
jgi:hypothetical protein